VRFDKWSYVIGAAAVVVAGVLGFLAGGRPGIFAAFAGLVPAVLWQVTTDRRASARAERGRLDRAEQLFVPRQIPGGVVRYLRAEAEVVAFWPRPELGDLHGWATSSLNTDVQLVTGEGGTGKTRLAIQFGQELRERHGWRSYWVPAGGEADAVAAGCQSREPVLLVFDYAETRPGIGDVLGQLITSAPQASVRVLLLARSAGEWWEQVVSGAGMVVSETLAAILPVTLGPLAGPAGQEEVYRQAAEAFATVLGVACPDTPVPASVGPGAPVLVVHAAALLAVLDQEPGTEVPAGGAGVIGGLLRHEERYWAQSQAPYGLALGPIVARRAVAAGTLVGADDEASAGRLLEAIGDLSDPGTRGRAARWLHDLYPAGQTGGGAAEWIAALRPDLVAENLVVGVLTGQPDLAVRLLDGQSTLQAERALTLLARAALTSPAARDLLGQVLAGGFPQLAEPALAVAVETSPYLGELLADLLEARPWPPEVLDPIARALPGPSVALARAAAATFRQLAAACPPGSEERGQNLIRLSNRLSELGRREDALAAIDEAVTACRQLAAARPDAFLPDLAGSLNNQSNRLSGLGRREDALAAIDEAVTAYRQLAAARPDAFLPDLAGSLTNQSVFLSGLGRREDALTAINEAVTTYRQLAAARPDAFLPDLAASLNNQSLFLSGLGRREDALTAIDEAVSIRRQLAAARPDAFLPDLATSLTNQSGCLSGLGRREDALTAADEAVTIRRQLAAARPDAFLPDLATSLNNQSNRLSGLGRREDALTAINEAVTIRRQLAAARPDAFLPDLATSLNNQSGCLSELGRREQALTAADEAVTIRRQLAAARPDAFLPDLATSLNNQSGCLSGLGRREDALTAINEAVTIRRQLAAARPRVFSERLASSLAALAGILDSLGRNLEAEQVRAEAARLQ
jgi:Tetratricopeptide repeat